MYLPGFVKDLSDMVCYFLGGNLAVDVQQMAGSGCDMIFVRCTIEPSNVCFSRVFTGHDEKTCLAGVKEC